MALSPVENVTKFQADISFEVKNRNHSKHWSYVLFLYLFIFLAGQEEEESRKSEKTSRK